MSEHQLRKLILDYIKLTLSRCWWRNNLGGIGQRRGIPDLIKVKTLKGRLSHYQESEIEAGWSSSFCCEKFGRSSSYFKDRGWEGKRTQGLSSRVWTQNANMKKGSRLWIFLE